ncbi:hypothetical protein MCP1_7820001 [Candidatus Terasakiella magnetica]|nr:hypothetical protein MCP1_7820001 [Candidatus Terasakiella magnetica]
MQHGMHKSAEAQVLLSLGLWINLILT